MDINITSQIVIKTSAQWAVDSAVYSDKRILVTSDAYYLSTDQRKYKIADGVQTWSQLDYMPILSGAETYFIIRSTGSDGHRWKFTCDDTGMISLPGEDLGV